MQRSIWRYQKLFSPMAISTIWLRQGIARVPLGPTMEARTIRKQTCGSTSPGRGVRILLHLRSHVGLEQSLHEIPRPFCDHQPREGFCFIGWRACSSIRNCLINKNSVMLNRLTNPLIPSGPGGRRFKSSHPDHEIKGLRTWPRSRQALDTGAKWRIRKTSIPASARHVSGVPGNDTMRTCVKDAMFAG